MILDTFSKRPNSHYFKAKSYLAQGIVGLDDAESPGFLLVYRGMFNIIRRLQTILWHAIIHENTKILLLIFSVIRTSEVKMGFIFLAYQVGSYNNL